MSTAAMLQAKLGLTQWLQPIDRYDLRANAVHVWRCLVGRDADLLSAAWRVLSPHERAKADRFHFEADRSRFVLGHGMLRRVLAQMLDRRAEDLRFETGRFGKPALAPGSLPGRLEFNLSHSGDMILLAVAADRAIGIDVERMRQDLPHVKMAQCFFSVSERASLAALPISVQAEAFYACWTRKEAYIKATGLGLSHPLNEFDVSLRPGDPVRLLATRSDADEARRWTMLELDVGPGYKAAAAVEGTEIQLNTWAWPALSSGVPTDRQHGKERSCGSIRRARRPPEEPER